MTQFSCCLPDLVGRYKFDIIRPGFKAKKATGKITAELAVDVMFDVTKITNYKKIAIKADFRKFKYLQI